MRALITLLAIFTVGIASAQGPRNTIALITEFTSNGVPHFSLNGENYTVENCFDGAGIVRGDSYTIYYQADGLDIDVDVDDTRYRVVQSDRATLGGRLDNLSFYNRIYDANGAHIPNSDLLDCPDSRAWILATGGTSGSNTQWFVNSEFPGWAYNEVGGNGGYTAYLTDSYDGFSSALNQQYIDNNLFGDTSYGNLASLEAAIEDFILQGSADVTWIEDIQLDASNNPNRINGASEYGSHSYTITFPLEYGQSHTHHGMGYHIEGTWIYSGAPAGEGTGNYIHPIGTRTYYIYYLNGVAQTNEDGSTRQYSLEEVMELFPNSYQTRIDARQFELIHAEPTLQEITETQEIVRRVIRDEFRRYAISRSNTRG